MKIRLRLKFSPLLAVGIAVLHFATFVVFAWFVIMNSLTGAGPGGPYYDGPGLAEITCIILAPTLILVRICGIEKLDLQVLLLLIAISSALYGVVISLLVSNLPKRRTEITEPMEKTESHADPY